MRFSKALAVEEVVLQPKQFLNLGFDGVVRWKSPDSTFFQFTNTCLPEVFCECAIVPGPVVHTPPVLLETGPHPPYSQDLTPSDFNVFGKLKKHLRARGVSFNTL
jgi:hypothetical protein